MVDGDDRQCGLALDTDRNSGLHCFVIRGNFVMVREVLTLSNVVEMVYIGIGLLAGIRYRVSILARDVLRRAA